MEQNVIKDIFIKNLIKKGKKNNIEKIYNNLLLNIKKKKKKQPLNIFNKVIIDSAPILEIKKISKFNSKIFYINKNKQIKRSIKWLSEPLLKKNKNKFNLFFDEFLNKKNKNFENKIKIYKESEKLKYNF